jgi:hypothetical protein
VEQYDGFTATPIDVSKPDAAGVEELVLGHRRRCKEE